MNPCIELYRSPARTRRLKANYHLVFYSPEPEEPESVKPLLESQTLLPWRTQPLRKRAAAALHSTGEHRTSLHSG